MKDITIIIPVIKHQDEKMKELTNNAISSARNMEGNEGPVMIVGPKDVLDTFEDKSLVKVVNDGDTSFCNQVNLGVSECKTKFFTVLEEDDEFTKKWFSNVEKYREFNKDVSVFIPLTEIFNYDFLDKGPVGYVNEVVWASSFSNEIGFIDLECLKNFMEFNLTGAVFNKKDFEAVGGLKSSMKLVYWYEFLMRFVNNDKKAMVIPKVGYHHVLNRPDSVSENYRSTINQDEAEWWIDLAQKEYLYKKDRKKTYEE